MSFEKQERKITDDLLHERLNLQPEKYSLENVSVLHKIMNEEGTIEE